MRTGIRKVCVSEIALGKPLLLWLLSLHFLTGCAKIPLFETIELEKSTPTNSFRYKPHHLGVFLIGFEVYSFKKAGQEIQLSGAVSYAGFPRYTKQADTLVTGIDSVSIFFGRLNSDLTFGKVELLTKTDCNGIFTIRFRSEKNGYLIFEGPDMTPTAHHSVNAFSNFNSDENQPVPVKYPCE